MLTIKHIHLSGEEMLYTSPIANYVPENATATIGLPASVWIEPGSKVVTSGTRYQLTGGTVFVMNEVGKTVARYDIGASMVPLSDDAPRKPPLPDIVSVRAA